MKQLLLIFACVSIFFFKICILICYIFSYANEMIYDFVIATEPTYDFIIVGGGTAGVIVANRLAAFNKTSVLLIESGAECQFPLFNIPVLSPLLTKSEFDWNYQTVPQEFSCFSLVGNASTWPRGRILGGSARLNNIVYIRGHRFDYDSWGNIEWTYNELLPYFKKSEYYIGHFKNDTTYHSTHGSVPVSDLPWATPLASSLLDAGKELGYAVNDLNGRAQTGFMKTEVNMFEGSRFPLPSLLQNYNATYRLKVLTHATVEKVLFFANYEASGVQYKIFDEYRQVKARKAVILCAGSIGTPQILMRSGIGPRNNLMKHKIPLVQDLPVGQNLQDHVATGLDLILLNTTLPLNSFTICSFWSTFLYYFYGTGPWTSPGCEAVGAVHTNLSNSEHEPPDIQIAAIPSGLSSDGGAWLRKSIGITQEVWEKYFSPLTDHQVASLLPVLLHPKSRGEVLLTGRNVDAPPAINPRYLSHESDIETLYQGILLVKKIIATQAMQKLGARLNTQPFPGCGHFTFDSRDYWICYIKHLTLTSFHPVGTCKMGSKSDATSVVDFDLRVHNAHGLYVMDASVMPLLPSSNINAAVMMIAEKGADILKSHWSCMTCRRIELLIPPVTSLLC